MWKIVKITELIKISEVKGDKNHSVKNKFIIKIDILVEGISA